MGLKITSSIEERTGSQVTNSYIWANFHTETVEIDGKVNCDLHVFRSQQDMTDNKSEIFPVQITTPVSFQFNGDETVKGSGVCKLSNVISFFYTKLKAELETRYSWTIELA